MSRKTFLLGLALVVLAFLAVATARYTPDAFGSVHDDTLYFSAAKSIAEGRGYRIASLPGEPPQTKYPALYPALLSLVWELDPTFPENVDWAWRLNLLCAALTLCASAGLLRQLGASRPEALALTAAMALQPIFIYWSDRLVSDLLFAALALSAAVLAHRELHRPQPNWINWAAVAALLALACMARTVGVAFVGGVVTAALWRRSWGRAAFALLGGVPIVFGLLSSSGGVALPDSASALPGFRQNFLYYTSYVEHWKESVPSWEILAAQLKVALTEALKYPAVAVFQLPAAGFVSMPLALISIAVSIGIVVGVVLRARKQGLHPIHAAAVFYLPIVLLWNYLLMDRFWLPFLALFLAGASHELLRIAGMAGQSWRKAPAADRVVIAGFGLAVCSLVAFAGYRELWELPQILERADEQRARLAEPKREAYRWLEDHGETGSAVISSDDAALYLYTDLQGMRPLAPLTDSFFAQSQSRLDRDLEGLTDTAAALHARYWIVSPDDFEMTHAPEEIRKRMAERLSDAPIVFSSHDGKVVVHDVSGMPWNPASEVALRSGEGVDGLK